MRGELFDVVVLLILSYVAHAQTKGLHSYQINPKPCRVNDVEGKCMFVWECINSGGTHIGMCVDAFMFGTCCGHNLSQAEVSRVPSGSGEGGPTVLFTPPLHHQNHHDTSHHGHHGHQKRPPGQLSRPSDNHQPSTRPPFVTRPHLSSSSSSSSHHYDKWTKPYSTTPRPVESVEGNQIEGSSSSWAGAPGNAATFITKPGAGRPTKLRPAPSLVIIEGPTTTTSTTADPTTTATTPKSTTSSGSTTKVPPVNVLPIAQASSSECGSAPLHARPEMRIVGGRNAQFGVWPWQVSVRRSSFFGFSSTHRCGGALINERWIATAGHCVDDLLTSQIRIRVGEYDFSSVQEPYPYAEKGVAKKAIHPKYNFFTYEYDLALVKLDSPLEFAPHIRPVCLPGSDDLLIGENATVTGWGRLSDGGTLPSVLQEVTVPILSNDRCRNMFLRAGRHEFFPEIFMCAGFDNGGRDACQGDSGGPLQVKGKDGRYFLAGIISWGIGCAEANLPGVCTRISKFVPWILQVVT
ncbi:serine protease [Nesidiocoris tenuis]|uniref:Serine protease n=1 Tax=Nesidiocoris tenuis TaxID=355587 RepID=A0ABN7BIQ3_9HEMI|nr:serine protease [Nesidiocoris tenuis]